MEYIILKLVNSEVVMGEVVAKEEDGIILKKPMNLMLDPMSGGVGMLPYDIVYTQKEYPEFKFKSDWVMYEIEPTEEYINSYIEMRSNIRLPKQGS